MKNVFYILGENNAAAYRFTGKLDEWHYVLLLMETVKLECLWKWLHDGVDFNISCMYDFPVQIQFIYIPCKWFNVTFWLQSFSCMKWNLKFCNTMYLRVDKWVLFLIVYVCFHCHLWPCKHFLSRCDYGPVLPYMQSFLMVRWMYILLLSCEWSLDWYKKTWSTVLLFRICRRVTGNQIRL